MIQPFDDVFPSKMDDSVLISKFSNGIVVLSLNRPNRVNSLSKEMVDQLSKCLYKLKNVEELRVLIIRSTVAGIFCAGADLKERITLKEKEILPLVMKLKGIADAIHDFPFPTIAAIDGAAIGGGFEYALAADLRVVATNAKMGLVETKLAVIPGAGGTQRLSRLIPIHLAKELIFTGRLVDGNEALQLGIANYCIDQNEHGDAAFRKSVQLAGDMVKNGPVALKMAKYAINKGTELDINSGLAIEALCYSLTVGTKDRLEGLASFIEKRSPEYRGK